MSSSTESTKRWRHRNPEHSRRLNAAGKQRQRDRTAPLATHASKRWTQVEDQVLLDNVDRTHTELALTLGRSYDAVQARLHKLRNRAPLGAKRPWTAADDRVLIDGAGRTARELGRVLGRSPGAVGTRRSVLRREGRL